VPVNDLLISQRFFEIYLKGVLAFQVSSERSGKGNYFDVYFGIRLHQR